MLMDTADDTSNKPIAIVSGLRSGFASATIFRNDETFWESLLGRKRAHIDGFGRGGGVLYALENASGLFSWVNRDSPGY